MAQTIVALVGENANGILECQSQRFLELIRPLGLEVCVLSLHDPEFPRRLTALLESGIAFGWGYAGIGARLATNDKNIWSHFQIPFISVLADAPYALPRNHHVGSDWVINGYIYRDWLDLQRLHVRSGQVSAMLPMGVIANPDRHRTPWSERPTRLLFVKTGCDPERLRARWQSWPIRLRHVLEDCATALALAPPGPILAVVQDCLLAHGLILEGSRPLLFRLLNEVDLYVRALRATAMARALLDLPADIVGSGWEHVQRPGARARFHPSVPAGELDARYAQAQILVNTTPNFATGAHERVLRGFAARACVISDENAFAASVLSQLPTHHAVDWSAADLPDRLASLLDGAAPEEGELDQAEQFTASHYDPSLFLARMAELAQIARLTPTLSGFALDAA